MKKTLITIALAVTAMVAKAVELPEIFSDNMMLQQQTEAKIWGWAKPGNDVSVTPSWDNKRFVVTAGKDGRWELTLQTPAASYTQYSILLMELEPKKGSKNADEKLIIDTKNITGVLVGEVWFCSGQSNMEMPLRGFWNCPVEGANEAILSSGQYRHAIRVATVTKADPLTPADRVGGTWAVCEPQNAPEFSAVGYFFARTLNSILNVPVGIINCSWGGSCVEGWMPKEILETYPDGLVPMDDTSYHRKMVMYNGMLYPLAGYTVKGFLWNQGESNVGKEQEYIDRFSTMTRHWRKLWGNDNLPMYAVEMPPYNYGDAAGDWGAKFRQAQHKIADVLDNYGCVATGDLIYDYEGEQVHGTKKQQIGQRLACMAATRDYGVKGIGAEAPQFEYMEAHEASQADIQVVAGTAVAKNANERGTVYHLYFTNSDDGFDRLSNIEGFEAKGTDGKWYPAIVWADSAWQNVKRQGCFLKLVCPDVDKVTAIRYCFRNFDHVTLHNLRGLPLVPFCTE